MRAARVRTSDSDAFPGLIPVANLSAYPPDPLVGGRASEVPTRAAISARLSVLPLPGMPMRLRIREIAVSKCEVLKLFRSGGTPAARLRRVRMATIEKHYQVYGVWYRIEQT